jgi:hypothetical protein
MDDFQKGIEEAEEWCEKYGDDEKEMKWLNDYAMSVLLIPSGAPDELQKVNECRGIRYYLHDYEKNRDLLRQDMRSE